MSSSKKKPAKGLCGRCLSEFIDWRQSVMLVFLIQLCELCCPSNLLSGSTLPTFPLPCVKTILYTRIQCVQFVRGGGVMHVVLSLRQINTCRKVPFQVNFFR